MQLHRVTILLNNRELRQLQRLADLDRSDLAPVAYGLFLHGLIREECDRKLPPIEEHSPSPLLPAGSSSNTSSLPPAGAPAPFGEQQAGDTFRPITAEFMKGAAERHEFAKKLLGHGAAVKDEQTATGPGPVGSKDVLDGAECKTCHGYGQLPLPILSATGVAVVPSDCPSCGGTGVDPKRQKPTPAPRLVLKSCPRGHHQSVFPHTTRGYCQSCKTEVDLRESVSGGGK